MFILDCLETLLPQAALPSVEPSSSGIEARAVQQGVPCGGRSAAGASDDRHQVSGAANAAPAGRPEATDATWADTASAATAMHLLLDLAPGCLERVAEPEPLRARAAALLQAILAAGGQPRPVLKVAQAFRLAPRHVADFQAELAEQVKALLADSATATPAVGLLRHFQVSPAARWV